MRWTTIALLSIGLIGITRQSSIGDTRGEPKVEWANAILERNGHAVPFDSAVVVKKSDYFGNIPVIEREADSGALADSGSFIATAGKGGRWFYDKVHGIAAGSTCCEYQGDLIAIAPPPPFPVASRNLSHVRSKLGLGLGLTTVEVANILGVNLRAITPPQHGFRFLRVIKFRGKNSAFQGLITFRQGRVVEVRLGITFG